MIEGLTAAEARAATKTCQPGPEGGLRPEKPDRTTSKIVAGVPVVRIVFRADRDISLAGMNRMEEALRETRRQHRADLLEAEGFPVKPARLGRLPKSTWPRADRSRG